MQGVWGLGESPCSLLLLPAAAAPSPTHATVASVASGVLHQREALQRQKQRHLLMLVLLLLPVNNAQPQDSVSGERRLCWSCCCLLHSPAAVEIVGEPDAAPRGCP